ncbi:MAG: glycosyltransferase family 39 protein [Desulfobacterales bacterium]
MRNKILSGLNFLIILLLLFLEYAWFKRLSAIYATLSAIMLFALVGIRIFCGWEKIRAFVNRLFSKIKTFVDQNRVYTAALAGLFLVIIVIGLPAVVYVERAMDADEAVEGIMGMHIYQGIERPITIYKMPINLTLKSHLAALFFTITGVSAKTLRAVDLLFYLCTIVLLYFLSLRIFGKSAAIITLFFFSMPNSYFYYMGLLRTGEYIEVLFFGTALLLLTRRYLTAPQPENQEIPVYLFSLIGFLYGIGFSTQALVLAFIVPTLIVLFLKDIKYFFSKILGRLVVFSFIGSFPLFIYNIKTNGATLAFLMHPPRVPPPMSLLEKGKIVISNIFFAFGNVNATVYNHELKITGPFQWIVVSVLLGLSFISLLFFVWNKRKAIMRWIKRDPEDENILTYILLILVIIITILLGLRPARPGLNPRYMTPLFAALPLILAWWLARFQGKVKYLFLLLIFINNSASILNNLSYLRGKDIERATLISKLDEMGIKYLRTGYWRAYPITFLTGERIIASGSFGGSSQFARRGDQVGFERHEPYKAQFFAAMDEHPEQSAYLFGSRYFERKLIRSLKRPFTRTAVAGYRIYSFNKNR